MSTDASGTSTPQSGGRSVVAAIEQTGYERTISRPTLITLIKLKQTDLLGKTPEKYTLAVKSRGGETLREPKWDSTRGGWPIDLVQIRGLDTENLSIELRELRVAGLIPWTIARGQLTVQEVESAIHASQDQLEMSTDILSQHALSTTDKKLVFILDVSTPSLVPIWITSIALADSVENLVDEALKNLDLVFTSRQGKRLRKSVWDSSRRCWNVGLPQLQGQATEELSIKLRRKRRGGMLHKTLTTVTLNIREGEQALSNEFKKGKQHFGIPTLDTKHVVLPHSVTQIVEKTMVISEVLEKLSGMLQKKCELDRELLDLIDSMNQLYECAIVQDGLKNYATFHVLFDAMIQQTIECFLFVSNYISDGYFRETCSTFVPAAYIPVLMRSLAGHMTTVSDKIDRFKSSFENLKTHFNNGLLRTSAITTIATKDLVVGLHESMHHLDNKLNLQDTKRVLEQELGTMEFRLPSNLPRCLLGTRQRTLSKILDWIVQGKESLLWLSGVAGSGKSSVMATLHDYLRTMGCSSHLAAYIRFRRSHFETPSKFVQALIYQLARFDSSLGALIAQAMKDDSILSLPLSHQLQSLLIQPLRMHKPDIKEQTQIVVLIDGLDECMQEAGGSDTFHTLLTLLSHLASPGTFHSFPFLRFIVASRPEEPIHAAFTRSLTPDNDLDDLPNILHFRLDTSSSETTADILKYLTTRFEEIFYKNHKFRELCKKADAVPCLANSSHGLFIWAYVISRFLGDFPSEERLQSALNMIIPKDSPGGAVLSNLYTTVLNGVAAEHGDEDIKSDIRSLIGLVIAVGRVKALILSRMPGLTKILLHGLLQHLTGSKADDILSLLPRLGAVIEGVHSPNAELFLLHKSLEDYLTDANRAGDAWYIDVKGHWIPKVAECCIQMVHSNVFSDTAKTSNILAFAHHYWTWAFFSQLDRDHPFPTECPLSHMFLDILQQGFLQWVYHAYSHKQSGSGGEPFWATYGGLDHMGYEIKETPKVVHEAFNIIHTWHPKVILGRFDETPTLHKYSLPQFSNIASGSRDFWTILHAIESVTNNSEADLFDWLKPIDVFRHESDGDSMVVEISGVPNQDVLGKMYDELEYAKWLDLSHYEVPQEVEK
ncbi:hypothetical protein V5O48_008819 [Marasmius crinis-equi]|uniref:Nephrocystin 3-like N-terminal domain-containing protein n=1 Tax=Marasmius crinis-equi TaxID=585013 RepID=A0ABR3FCU3_9AGAR